MLTDKDRSEFKSIGWTLAVLAVFALMFRFAPAVAIIVTALVCVLLMFHFFNWLGSLHR